MTIDTKKRLRVSTVVVGAEEEGNELRIKISKGILVSKYRSDLVVFPAGYLRARSEAEVREVAAPVLAAARKAKTAVVVGVDTGGRGSVRLGTLPHFLLGWSPGQSKASMWRQRSITSADAGDAPDGAFASARSLVVDGQNVAPIICGEVFSPRVRESVAKLKPAVAVLAAHTASGARHWAAQRCLAQLGVNSVRAVHADGARNVLCGPDREDSPYHVIVNRGIVLSYFAV